MLTTAAILATAVGLIAVQPLLLRTWPWLDRYGLPRRPGARQTLWEAVSAAARALPVPTLVSMAHVDYRTALEQRVPLAEALARRRGMQGTIVPAGWGYIAETDRYCDMATGMTASRVELQAGLGNAADVRLRQALACAAADGHAQTARTLEAARHDLDLQRHMGAAQLRNDRTCAAALAAYEGAHREWVYQLGVAPASDVRDDQ